MQWDSNNQYLCSQIIKNKLIDPIKLKIKLEIKQYNSFQ